MRGLKTLALLAIAAMLMFTACGNAQNTGAASRTAAFPPSTTAPPSTTMPSATPPPTQTQTATPSPAPSPTATPIPSPTATNTPKAKCGGPPTLTVLVVGSYPTLYGMGDAIRLIRVDFVHQRVAIVPIPRDLYVDLPWDSPYPSPVKITSAYFLGTPAMQRGAPRDGGAKLLAATIQYNFGIKIDRYFVASADGFRKFIDAIGGIPVYIPYRIYDPPSNSNFYPGAQYLNGYQALALARARQDRGGFVRAERQGWILKGILKSIAEPETLKQIPDIFKIFKSSIITNLTPKDIAEFVCLYGDMLAHKREAVVFNVPNKLVRGTREWIFIGKEPHTAFVVKWDERYRKWLHDALDGKISP